MKKTYWVVIVAMLMGAALNAAAAGPCADWHQKRGSGAWGIRRWLRLGRRRKDP